MTAVDLTHAPASGFDAHARARLIVARRDPRIKYVISNGEIARGYAKPGIPAWTWTPYTGANQHRQHAHFSVHNTPAARDDLSPWWPHSAKPTSPPPPVKPKEPIVPELEIITAFGEWLGRPHSDSELALHTWNASVIGVPKAVLGIARSEEASARRTKGA